MKVIAYDSMRAQQWEAAIRHCQQGLERDDLRKVRDIAGSQDVEVQIELLQRGKHSIIVSEELDMLWPTLSHFENLSTILSNTSQGTLSVSVFWGVLLLAIELAVQSDKAIHRLAKMLRRLGERVDLFITYHKSSPRLRQIEQAVLDVHIELLSFVRETVKFYRGDAPVNTGKADNEVWDFLSRQYETNVGGINEVLSRIQQFAGLARSESHVEEIIRIKELIFRQNERPQDKARLPCIMLPIVKNTKIYDRNDIITMISERFNAPDSDKAQVHAIALFGLGGVGKSQVALKYAHSKTRELDMVGWMYSQTPTALAQSFTDLAIRLQLPNAHPQHHAENRILVLGWLQKTSAKWLLVFDNAEDQDILLEYWPLASPGLVLITTRNHNIAFEPANTGIEIPHFDPDNGSGLLLHLLATDVAKDLSNADIQSARELSDKLNGHALAISHMAGLIHRRSWSIQELLGIYSSHTREMHENSLDATWRLSFASLDLSASHLLGVLSLLMPDCIPQTLFEPAKESALGEDLGFCRDTFKFSEVLETLLTLALIKRDRVTKTFSIHRLVQTQFRFHMSRENNQKSFEAAAALLNEAFPGPGTGQMSGQMYNVWKLCERYLQHVLSLSYKYREESSNPTPLRPTLDFCRLLLKCARFLIENASYVELGQILDTTLKAYAALDENSQKQDPLLLAHITRHTSTNLYHRGDFTQAERFLHESLAIHYKNPDPGLKLLDLPFNQLGNVTASANKYEESLDWQLKQKEILNAEDSVAPIALVHCNIGRSLWLLRRDEEALAKYKLAEDLFLGSENWGALALTFFALGNLYRRQGSYLVAEDYYSKTKNVWTENGQTMTHVIMGSCMYKLGCIALDRNEVQHAINLLRDAKVISQLRKQQLVGDYARALFKLSQALKRRQDNYSEAEDLALEAKSLYRSIRDGFPKAVTDEDEKPWDDLVCILWR